MREKLIYFFITIAGGILLAGCEKTPTAQQNISAATPVEISQQAVITKELLGLVLTESKLKLFQSGTRDGEESENNFRNSIRQTESRLIGKEAENWICSVEEGTIGGNLVTPIDFLRESYPATKFSCYGNYKAKTMPTFDNKNEIVTGYKRAYELEHYIIEPSANSKQKLGKLYIGDKVKFSAKISKINVGIMVNMLEIYFEDAEISLIK